MAINALSILIPTYNDECVMLVDDLRQQAEQAGIVFEILVGDDGSIKINGSAYKLCSQWFDKDREKLMAWIKKNNKQ